MNPSPTANPSDCSSRRHTAGLPAQLVSWRLTAQLHPNHAWALGGVLHKLYIIVNYIIVNAHASGRDVSRLIFY